MADTDTPLNEKERKTSLNDVEGAEDVVIILDGQVVNASGHRDQLQRQYGLLSICGLALTVDNAWVALGTSLAVSICTLAKYTTFQKADKLAQTTAVHQVLFGNCG
jgi:choline transport protein